MERSDLFAVQVSRDLVQLLAGDDLAQTARRLAAAPRLVRRD
jgi:hypothetical protein